MAVTIKSQREVEIMREAGKILAFVHEELEKMVKPGVSTMELNKKADELMRKYGCIPSFLGLYGTAADLKTPSGWTPAKLAAIAREIMPDWGGVGVYSWGIHVDVREEKVDWNG